MLSSCLGTIVVIFRIYNVLGASRIKVETTLRNRTFTSIISHK